MHCCRFHFFFGCFLGVMPVEAFHRTDAVTKTPPWETPCESSPARSVCASDASRRTWATTAAHGDVQPYLDAIRRELVELRERREGLEERRRGLLQMKPATVKETQPAHDHAATSRSTGGLSSLPARSDVESATAFVVANGDGGVVVGANGGSIASELACRRRPATTPHLTLKHALQMATKDDSTLVMGDFLLEDNPRVCTFGRERRFRPLVERLGWYYMASDAAAERGSRGRQRPSAGWQTAVTLSDETPGPGAYTPQYNKASRPSRLC